MSGFIEGKDRHQGTLFPESLDEYIAEDSTVRVIDVFIDDLNISGLGFKTEPSGIGRPGYHPKMMLKLYVYGYLNQVQSSRRLKREAHRIARWHCAVNAHLHPRAAERNTSGPRTEREPSPQELPIHRIPRSQRASYIRHRIEIHLSQPIPRRVASL